MTRVPFNIVLATDSYKLTHPGMLRPGTTHVYSYGAFRGGPYPTTVFYGMQSLLNKYFVGSVVEPWVIDEAEELHAKHFIFGNTKFDRAGWERIVRVHDGRLPIEIKARPEGGLYPTGVPVFTVVNTDPELPWLTNHLESLLLHVWYPSTVATVSFHLRQMFRNFVSDDFPGLEYMLHDFGFRGVSSLESAGLGGSAHLLSFKGSDTLEAIREIVYSYSTLQYDSRTYGSRWDGLAHSVAATEHSIMTQDGIRYSDIDTVKRLIPIHEGGLLSVVADSYDYIKFVQESISAEVQHLLHQFRVKLVIRPDSMTEELATPSDVVVWTLRKFQQAGMTVLDDDGLMLIDNKYGILWGDGLTPDQIKHVLQDTTFAGFSAKNLVFGMGGGLLQKVNRDTMKAAVKASAIMHDGVWHDVYKETPGKPALRGRFDDPELQTIFKNGSYVGKWVTFSELRERLRNAEKQLKSNPYLRPTEAPKVEMFTGTN